mmetsp:Transcript_894/g.2081  ORF Transcript_894/g.2081 Transcript_894/m.2081 type:complete len:325 (-) Transcript_894:2193-3167(-)
MPITSPVERISGPSRVSAPTNLSKGSTASFTATWLILGSSVKWISSRVMPAISRLAYLAMGWPTALATKGTVREARGLASMMYSFSPWTAYWMFMRPTTLSSLAILGVQSRTWASTSSVMVCVGMMQALSPLCTPASSMCSMMPQMTTLPSLSARQSTSISTAPLRYLSTSTGWLGSTSTAVSMYSLSSSSLYTMRMARPPSTKLGRTMQGYPSLAACASASSSLVAVPPGGWSMLSLVSTWIHCSRSSAASMDSGWVPQILTTPSPLAVGMGLAVMYLFRAVASLSGVWPPNCTMMPSGRSTSTTLSTSSRVSGSKYRRLEVS